MLLKIVVQASEMENEEKESIGTVVHYIDSSTCHNKYLQEKFHLFVTSDKFCAETKLGITNLIIIMAVKVLILQ